MFLAEQIIPLVVELDDDLILLRPHVSLHTGSSLDVNALVGDVKVNGWVDTEVHGTVITQPIK